MTHLSNAPRTQNAERAVLRRQAMFFLSKYTNYGNKLRKYQTIYRHHVVSHLNRDPKQARTATAVNKQLNFTVKNKAHTTNYIYCIFEAYFMIKSV